jgi:hypothetical protein
MMYFFIGVVSVDSGQRLVMLKLLPPPSSFYCFTASNTEFWGVVVQKVYIKDETL